MSWPLPRVPVSDPFEVGLRLGVGRLVEAGEAFEPVHVRSLLGECPCAARVANDTMRFDGRHDTESLRWSMPEEHPPHEDEPRCFCQSKPRAVT